jgi:hypothetical protein
MTKKKLSFKIPEELHDIFCEYKSMLDLKESYVNKYFGFRKAKKCAIQAEKAENKFWNKVLQICPKNLLYGKEFKYVPILRIVKVIDKKGD